MEIPKKQGIKLPYDSTISLLVISLRKPQLRKVHVPNTIAALFTVARTWRQFLCPSRNEWIKKLWYTYTVEYYSAIKMHLRQFLSGG